MDPKIIDSISPILIDLELIIIKCVGLGESRRHGKAINEKILNEFLDWNNKSLTLTIRQHHKSEHLVLMKLIYPDVLE